MLADTQMRHEVAIACVVARIVAIALPIVQCGLGLRGALARSIGDDPFALFRAFLLTPLVTGVGLYLLALFVGSLARIEVRCRLRDGRPRGTTRPPFGHIRERWSGGR